MLDKLQPASFKGVSFLVDSVSTEGGRKLVTHEYPNTGRRFVEDLGDLQETFTINGFVTGIDYNVKRDALIAALKSPDRGELVHPMFGVVTVVAKPYTLSEVMTEFGVAKFTMVFEKSDESTFPGISGDNTSIINTGNDLVAQYMGQDIANIFSVRKSFPANFLSAKSILTGVSSAMGINATNVLKVASEVSSFSGFLLGFTTNINKNINDPSGLAYDFGILFGSFSTIGRNARDQFSLLTSLFRYGSTETPTIGTTAQRIEREKNRRIINSAVNINALSNAYNTVPQLAFTTEDDIKIVQGQLDSQFDYIISDNNVSDETIQSLKDIKVQVEKFLEQQIVNVFKISTISTHEIPMTILCHQYYGSVDNTTLLLDLNNTIDCSYVDGEVKILTS